MSIQHFVSAHLTQTNTHTFQSTFKVPGTCAISNMILATNTHPTFTSRWLGLHNTNPYLEVASFVLLRMTHKLH